MLRLWSRSTPEQERRAAVEEERDAVWPTVSDLTHTLPSGTGETIRASERRSMLTTAASSTRRAGQVLSNASVCGSRVIRRC